MGKAGGSLWGRLFYAAPSHWLGSEQRYLPRGACPAPLARLVRCSQGKRLPRTTAQGSALETGADQAIWPPTPTTEAHLLDGGSRLWLLLFRPAKCG